MINELAPLMFSHAVMFFAGVGVAIVAASILTASRDIRALNVPEPTSAPPAPVVIATGIDAYLGAMVQPEPPAVDQSWKPWRLGWAGEPTGILPIVDLDAPQPRARAERSRLPGRERWPNLDRRLRGQLEVSYRDYPRIRIPIGAAA